MIFFLALCLQSLLLKFKQSDKIKGKMRGSLEKSRTYQKAAAKNNLRTNEREKIPRDLLKFISLLFLLM